MYLYEVTHHFSSATLHVLANDVAEATSLTAKKLISRGHTNTVGIAVDSIHSITKLFSIDAGLPE